MMGVLGACALSANATRFVEPNLGQTKPPTTKARAKTSFGDVTVEDFDRLRGKTDLSGVQIFGAKTLITVPYKRNRSLLKIHADQIITKSEGKDSFASSELSGNVRFTLTQTAEDGTVRTLEGTAQRALFRRIEERIELIQAVRATLTDPEKLAEPGTLQGGHLEVNLKPAPYRYTLTGAASETRVVLKAKGSAKKGDASAASSQEFLAQKFRKGVVQLGEMARLEGDETVLVLKDKAESSEVEVRSPEIEARFSGKSAEIGSIEAKQRVAFDFARPGKEGKSTEALKGACERILYTAERDSVELLGKVVLTVVVPSLFDTPMHVVASRVVAKTVAPYRYDLKANPKTALISFTVKPIVAKAAEGKKPGGEKNAFAFGDVRVTQFHTGSFEEGKQATFEGERLVLESVDAKSRSHARFVAKTFTANFAERNVLRDAVIDGNVEFFVQQKPEAKKSEQAIRGSAKRLVFANKETERTLEVQGVFQALFIAPDLLAKPGTLKGLAGDKLILYFVEDSYEFDIQSDNQTASIELEPLEKKPEEKKPEEKKPEEKKPEEKKP
jgi:hypothetical protein